MKGGKTKYKTEKYSYLLFLDKCMTAIFKTKLIYNIDNEVQAMKFTKDNKNYSTVRILKVRDS